MSNKSATPGHYMSDRSFAPDDFQTAYSPSFDSDILTRFQGASDMTIATRPVSATTAAPTGLAARRRSSQRLPDAGNTRSWWIMALMVSAFSFCMVMQFRQSPYELSSKPIDTIRLGDNVPGVNPAEADDLTFGTTVDRESWRHVRLTARHGDGTLVEIRLLRPDSWLRVQQAAVGGTIRINVPECGIEGMADVLAINDCPTLQPTPSGYRTVTGTFRHESAEILDVQVAGQSEPIGTTAVHPFWSEDRQTYVAAGELDVGEHLLGHSGPAKIKSLAPRGIICKSPMSTSAKRCRIRCSNWRNRAARD